MLERPSRQQGNPRGKNENDFLIEDGQFQRIANERALVAGGHAVTMPGTARKVCVSLASDAAQSVGSRCSSRSQGRRARKTHPVIVLSGPGQANETKLMSEGRSSVCHEIR
jgi:hypothetical protein